MNSQPAAQISVVLRIGTVCGMVVFLTGCIIPVPYKHDYAPALPGQVLDASTGKPIAGVRIDYRFPGKRRTGHVVTDAAGGFRIEKFRVWACCPALGDFEPLPHDLTISHSGYGAFSVGVQSRWHVDGPVLFYLSAAGVIVAQD